MRSICFFNLILLLAASGCTVPGFGTKSQTPTAPAANETSWTDKMTAPLKSLAPKKTPPVAKAAPDPISLGFESGPATPALYVSMATLSDQGGNTAHARGLYQKALSMDPKNLDALLGLARMEDREGNLQEALRIYQQAVDAHPQDARALNDLALCHARCGNMQQSHALLSQAVKMHPDKALYRNNIAKVLIEMHQLDQAVVHLSSVNDPAVANYNMAVLLQERGRTAEAVPYLNKALVANPQMTEASTMLANLTGQAPAPQTAAAAPAITLAAPAPAVASVPATQAPAASAPVIMSNPHADQIVAASNNDITPTPYLPDEQAAPAYPSTGAPEMIPVPAQTARVPAGYEPMLLPPIR